MPEHDPIQDPDHLLPPHKKKVGPIIGTIIILVVLIIGGIFFWGSVINHRTDMANQVPYIPSGTTTLPTITVTASSSASQ